MQSRDRQCCLPNCDACHGKPFSKPPKARYEFSIKTFPKQNKKTKLTNCVLDLQVDSARKHGILLEAVQVLTDLNLSIKKAYISSDGRWFMDGKRKKKANFFLFIFCCVSFW